jgi:Tfp pilus assembly protein PilN
MIEINLLPGARKKTRSKGPSLDLGALLGGVTAQVRDPFLIVGVVGLVLGAAATGFLYLRQGGRARDLTERENQAVQDSTRFAAVLAERRNAETQRDSVLRQLNIIRQIDSERYIWPHLLDEVSRALPPYTWVRTIQQTSAPVSIGLRDSTVGPNAKAIAAAADSAVAAEQKLTVRLVGQTVDIQALTRFMRVLEQSPFVTAVNLARSDVVVVGSSEVTEFTLDFTYEKPDPSVIRTAPLTIAVR